MSIRPGATASPAGTSVQVADASRNDPLGLTLTKYGQKVLSKGTSGFDSLLVESPCVWKDATTGRYEMIYVGYSGSLGSQVAALGRAYSYDLLTWTKVAGAFFSASGTGGAPDQYGASGPLMIYEGGVYYLFYIGLTAVGYEAGTKTICLATATSLAGPWTRLGSQVSPSGAGWRSTAIWHPSIVKRGSTYYMFFNATGSPNARERIGYATATSLLGPWTVDDVNSPLVGGGASEFAGDPFVRRVGDLWLMDYYSLNGSNAQDMIASTSDSLFPLGWSAHATNRVTLTAGPGSYDILHAHKPWIIEEGGNLYHFYTAVDAADTDRGIALATNNSRLKVSQTVSGSRSDGTALASLINQLIAVGVPLADATTAATVLAADAFTNRSGTLIGTTSSHGETVLSWGDTNWAISGSKATFTGAGDSGIGYQPATATTDNYTVSVTVGTVNGTFPVSIIPVYNTSALGVLMYLQSSTWKIKVDGVTSGTVFNDVVAVSGDTFTVTKAGTSYTLKRVRATVTTTIGTWTGISPATVTGKMGYGGNGGNQPLEVTAFSVTSP